ncbi:MAG: leucine--tRNA ligase [Bacteroidia bacterium]|nr:leucine--tRNA ligase [Bacteroidia bacterium]
MDYHFKDIEQRWQKFWAENKTFRTEDASAKPKYYVLDMFPYPSGAGLHVGHPLGYIASDIVARYKRHKGFNVLHPMGYDSFGLPAEQYAIQTGQHPAITTEQNINRYREQLDKIGFSFDWEREVRTSDPEYYKWTQWIFIQLFNAWYNPRTNKTEHIDSLIKVFETEGFKGDHHDILTGDIEHNLDAFTSEEWKKFDEKKRSDVLMNFRIAYLGEAYVNWCPALGTVLANDEVKEGVSERGGYPVEKKLMKQWSMRITAYSQRLLDGLDKIDWTDSLKESQRNWIGKSEGTSLRFKVLTPNPSPRERGTKLYYLTADADKAALLLKLAKNNRKGPTPSEDILWQALRNRKVGGFKFRRQHPIKMFIADFVCLEKNIVVEIDGGYHFTDEQKKADEIRTSELEIARFKVIRFTNEEVLNDLDSVCQQIRQVCEDSPSPMERGPGGEDIEVFTTRPDTIFGVSFVTLAPEHELVSKITTDEFRSAVDAYVTMATNRSERDRMADVKNVSGQFTGAYAIHPFTGKNIPVYIGDYVLAGYGTGAVMAVPAHDERDFKFATHFKLEKPQVITPTREHSFEENSWDEKEGKLVNSDFLNGLEVKAAIKKAIEKIEEKKIGNGKINFRLRDAVFGRQRYWGEPIPVYYKNGIPHCIPENELPLVLPEVDKFLPTEDGEPPLARAKDWKYKGEFDYEHTTMPGWAGSSWYFLRYMDANNKNEFVSKNAVDYWGSVDLYLGGSEHATGHLLYVRFWTMALKDLGFINVEEPAKKLINQGMIQGRSNFIYKLKDENKYVSFGLKDKYETRRLYIDVNLVSNDELNLEEFKNLKNSYLEDNCNAEFILEDAKYICGYEVEKMSKSKWNVVSPDKICAEYGADCLRLYEMFLGPLELSKPWNTNGITGVYGFLKKLWRLFYASNDQRQTTNETTTNDKQLTVSDEAPTKEELKTLHKTIKKITEDIDRFSFNTSVSSFMICVNELTELKCNKRQILEPLLILISPYAPHISEELWNKLGHNDSIAFEKFPEFNPEYLVESNFSYPVSFNGKTRFQLELPVSLTVQEIEKEVMSREEVKKYLGDATPKKIIIVPKRIINIVH